MADQANVDVNVAERHLDGLDDKFMVGLEKLRAGEIDAAAEIFRRVLQVEPRLAEPRIELARILMETKQLTEAEAEAREAIRILESGGQWIDALKEPQVLSIAFGILAEILRVRGESDEVVFGDPEKWRNIVDEAHAAFRKARELDPENAHAGYWAGGFDVDVDGGAEDDSGAPGDDA